MEKEYLLNKWLNQELSDAEMEEFRKREDYEDMVALLENAKNFKASHFSTVNSFEEFESSKMNRLPQEHKRSWFRPIMRIAAVLVLGVSVLYFLSRNDYTEIETLARQKETVQLPDGSSVVLNALSAISYGEDTWQENRTIEMEGEAFFKVEKGSKFTVKTPTATIEVLGTEFNVKNRMKFFEVVCYEGSVAVRNKDIDEVLKAGEFLRFQAGSIERATHGLSQPGWTKNISSFESVPLSEVLDEMERQYDVEINLLGADGNLQFTGVFVHNNLENALRSVTEPMDLEYKIENNKIVSVFPSER